MYADWTALVSSISTLWHHTFIEKNVMRAHTSHVAKNKNDSAYFKCLFLSKICFTQGASFLPKVAYPSGDKCSPSSHHFTSPL